MTGLIDLNYSIDPVLSVDLNYSIDPVLSVDLNYSIDPVLSVRQNFIRCIPNLKAASSEAKYRKLVRILLFF
jgi:hypothetical protein